MTGDLADSPDATARLAPAPRLKLTALTCLAYFTVCGGAFGIEPLVGAVGPGWAMVLIFVTPVI